MHAILLYVLVYWGIVRLNAKYDWANGCEVHRHEHVSLADIAEDGPRTQNDEVCREESWVICVPWNCHASWIYVVYPYSGLWNRKCDVPVLHPGHFHGYSEIPGGVESVPRRQQLLQITARWEFDPRKRKTLRFATWQAKPIRSEMRGEILHVYVQVLQDGLLLLRVLLHAIYCGLGPVYDRLRCSLLI